MIDPKDILLGGVLPFVIALAVMVVAARLRGERSAWIDAAAVAIGFLSGYLGLAWLGQVAPLRWVPIAAEEWLPHIAVVALAISLIAAGVKRSWPAWVLRVPLVIAVVWITLKTYITYDWTAGQSMMWVAVVSSGALLVWGATRYTETTVKTEARTEGPLTPIVAAITAFGVANACLFGASIKLAQIAGALTAALGAMAVFSLFNRSARFHPATTGFAIAAALLLNATAYAELRMYVAIVLLAVPVVPLMFTCKRCDEWRAARPVLSTVVIVLVCAAVITAVLLPSALEFVERMQEMESYEYQY